jgi:hypothetical protein
MKYRRSVAFVLAAAIGFATLAAIDASRPTRLWFDRLTWFLTGFGVARTIGLFAGVPLREGKVSKVTKRGLLAAFPVALATTILSWSLLFEVVAPALEWPPSWQVDLILAGVALAMLPLFLLSIRIDSAR